MKDQNKYRKIEDFIRQFVFGGVAAFISKTITSPLQVVKLRLQVQSALVQKGHLTHNYNGFMDCLQRLYAQNGIYTYFKGNATNASRFFLTQALNFSFRDLIKKIIIEKIQNQQQSSKLSINIISGGLAGALTLFLVYPLDFARTRLSNQVSVKNTPLQYVGFIDCITKIYKSQGIKGIYIGFSISCLCMMLYRGLYFGLYDTFRPYLSKSQGENMIITFGLGYLATIISGAVSYPLDTLRRRIMMTSGQNKKYKNAFECARQVHKQGGWRAFFKGGAANVAGGITGAAVLSIYDKLKNQIFKNNKTQ